MQQRDKHQRDDRGASAVEYGLLITGVAAIIAATVFLFGGFVGDLFRGNCDTFEVPIAANGGTAAC